MTHISSASALDFKLYSDMISSRRTSTMWRIRCQHNMTFVLFRRIGGEFGELGHFKPHWNYQTIMIIFPFEISITVSLNGNRQAGSILLLAHDTRNKLDRTPIRILFRSFVMVTHVWPRTHELNEKCLFLFQASGVQARNTCISRSQCISEREFFLIMDWTNRPRIFALVIIDFDFRHQLHTGASKSIKRALIVSSHWWTFYFPSTEVSI